MVKGLTKTNIRMIFAKTTAAFAILLRIIGCVIAMVLLLCTICYGYEAATEPRIRQLYGQWVSHTGALIMLFGFLLLVLGLPVISDLYLRLSEELRYPEETEIRHGTNLKVDVSV